MSIVHQHWRVNSPQKHWWAPQSSQGDKEITVYTWYYVTTYFSAMHSITTNVHALSLPHYHMHYTVVLTLIMQSINQFLWLFLSNSATLSPWTITFNRQRPTYELACFINLFSCLRNPKSFSILRFMTDDLEEGSRLAPKGLFRATAQVSSSYRVGWPSWSYV